MKKIVLAALSLALLLSCVDDEKLFHATVAEVNASSFVMESVLAHGRCHPLKALDGDPLTAWNEAAKGPGIGEWIEITFDKPVRADTITLMPGFHDPAWYAKNNRIKSLEMTLDGGQTIQAELTDGMDEKTIALEKDTTFSKIRLAVKDAYKGTKYDDTCLSEIAFYLYQCKIELDTEAKLAEEDKRAQIASMGSPLGKTVEWYSIMGNGTSSYFFDDHVFVSAISSELSPSSRVIGNWKLDKANTIMLTNLQRCDFIGRRKYISDETMMSGVYEHYDYKVTVLPAFAWRPHLHDQTGQPMSWNEFLKLYRSKDLGKYLNIQKINEHEIDTQYLKTIDKNRYMDKRIASLREEYEKRVKYWKPQGIYPE